MKKASGRVALQGCWRLWRSASLFGGAYSAHSSTASRSQAGAFQYCGAVCCGQLGAACGAVPGLPEGGFALLTRGVTAGLLSISGGVLSALVMWLLLQKTRASLSLVGVCGALSHCAAQLLRGLAAHFGCCGILSAFFSFVRRVNRSAHRTGAEAYPAAAAKN